jgi:hypothetical protein
LRIVAHDDCRFYAHASRKKQARATVATRKSFTQSNQFFKKTRDKYRFEKKKLKAFSSTIFSSKKKRKISYRREKILRIIKLRSGKSILYPRPTRPVRHTSKEAQ